MASPSLRASLEACSLAAGTRHRRGQHDEHHFSCPPPRSPTPGRRPTTASPRFGSPEVAKAFFAMPELKEEMSQAGVDADSVQISYLDEVEASTLVGI